MIEMRIFAQIYIPVKNVNLQIGSDRWLADFYASMGNFKHDMNEKNINVMKEI